MFFWTHLYVFLVTLDVFIIPSFEPFVALQLSEAWDDLLSHWLVQGGTLPLLFVRG